VRRQPGFISKVLLQAEDELERVAMLLTWESAAQAIAWTKRPEHDEVSRPPGEFADRSDAAGRGALQRGGYRVLAAVAGAPLAPAPRPRGPTPPQGEPFAPRGEDAR